MLLSDQKLELRVRAKRLKKLWRICTEATELYLDVINNREKQQ